jgi:beta-aspartyl-peptidase (threonine type)
LTLKEASELVVNDKLVKAGGSGGVIGVDSQGNIAMPFNSKGMFRGFATADGEEGVFIYEDEELVGRSGSGSGSSSKE